MCIRCNYLVKQLKAKGWPEKQAIDVLWNFTPFPVGHPTIKQIKNLSKMIYANRRYG